MSLENMSQRGVRSPRDVLFALVHDCHPDACVLVSGFQLRCGVLCGGVRSASDVTTRWRAVWWRQVSHQITRRTFRHDVLNPMTAANEPLFDPRAGDLFLSDLLCLTLFKREHLSDHYKPVLSQATGDDDSL